MSDEFPYVSPPKDPPPKVFISDATADKQIAGRIKLALSASGVDAFLAHDDKLAAQIPTAKLNIVTDAKHSPHRDQPQVCAALIRNFIMHGAMPESSDLTMTMDLQSPSTPTACPSHQMGSVFLAAGHQKQTAFEASEYTQQIVRPK